MKKKSSSKLLLNKVSIVELNGTALLNIKGGIGIGDGGDGQTGQDKPLSSNLCQDDEV